MYIIDFAFKFVMYFVEKVNSKDANFNLLDTIVL
jgi:hypothetical protein